MYIHVLIYIDIYIHIYIHMCIYITEENRVWGVLVLDGADHHVDLALLLSDRPQHRHHLVV